MFKRDRWMTHRFFSAATSPRSAKFGMLAISSTVLGMLFAGPALVYQHMQSEMPQSIQIWALGSIIVAVLYLMTFALVAMYSSSILFKVEEGQALLIIPEDQSMAAQVHTAPRWYFVGLRSYAALIDLKGQASRLSFEVQTRDEQTFVVGVNAKFDLDANKIIALAEMYGGEFLEYDNRHGFLLQRPERVKALTGLLSTSVERFFTRVASSELAASIPKFGEAIVKQAQNGCAQQGLLELQASVESFELKLPQAA